MDNRGLVTLTEIFDKDGNLTKIEAHNEKGDFELQALWDYRDIQDHDNRQEFRKWVRRHLGQSGYLIKD